MCLQSKTISDEMLKEQLAMYLEKRNSTAVEEEVESTSSSFDFLKPSGWHKDKVEIEFQLRTDNRIPKKQFRHPLAYVDLKRFGFEDLIEPIIERGGPIVVGERLLGLNWTQEREEWDPSLKPTRVETWALDMRGSLMLGGALEDKLAAAEMMDLEELKVEAKRKEELRSLQTTSTTPGQGEDYRSEQRRLTKRFKIDKQEEGEGFSLTLPQRGYFLTVSALFAFAYGRSSQELNIQGISALIESSRALVEGAALASLGSGVLCAIEAKKLDRSAVIWAAKGLLGGPLAVYEIRSSVSNSSSIDNLR